MKRGFSTSLLVLAGIFLLSVSCDDDKTSLPEGGEGVNEFPVTLTEADYNPDNTYYLLNDDESPDVFFDASQRNFYVTQPLQIQMDDEHNFQLRFTAQSPEKRHHLGHDRRLRTRVQIYVS